MDLLEIHDQYYHRVRKFILASVKDESVADDLTQETFIKIQGNLDTLRDRSKISSWVFQIAYYLCQDHFRGLKNSSTHEEIHEGLVNIQETPVQKKMEQEEMSQCVQDQLNLLPEAMRSILILADIMDFTHQEIADILGLSVENVKVRVHRARKKLKAILKEKCTFEVDERNVLICEPVEIKNGR
ncbi:MAG: sigma-70 family RNA polymerase sigma factor [Deltaproteobacteria bacterium]|nr:sigma-70 family RNA polymerase sigma factor [Deltaproteobacteria bacterium]